MRNKITITLLALVLCASAFVFPLSAYAAGGNDTTPPTLEIKKDGDKLSVAASDDISGVEAVYIDENRINSLANGKATVILKDYAGTEKKISVYAVDYAGNRSEVKTLDNPYYKEPVAAQTPAATQSASSPVTTTQQPAAQSSPGAASRSQATSQPQTAQPTQTPQAQEPEETESTSVSSIPEGAFTPEGTGTVLDRATGAEGDKQFYTITTDAGNVFYLIVDGKRDSNNVYFLNGVTEADLMALAEKDDNVSISSVPPVETCICTDKCEAGHVNTDCPVCKNDLTKCTGKATAQPTKEPKEPEPEKSGSAGTIIFLVIAVIAVAGIGYYVKIVRPKKQAAFDDDDGFEEEGYGEDFGDYDREIYLPEDDTYSDGDGE